MRTFSFAPMVVAYPADGPAREEVQLRTSRILSAVVGLTLAGALAAPAEAATSSSAPAASTTQSSDSSSLIAQINALLPSDMASRVANARARFGIEPGPGADAINPGDYQCQSTDFRAWILKSISSWTTADRKTVNDLALTDLPTYDALVYGSSADPNYALTSHAKDLTKTFSKLRSFWDINSSDIDLMAMHGSTLTDAARIERTYISVFELSPAQAKQLAPLVVQFVNQAKFEYGNHPYFTLNAFAYSGFGHEEIPGRGVIGDRIVMGDGILRALDELGFADISAQSVLAHEFGHHVQFENGMITFTTANTPEGTRRTELHADASASYFLSHPQGMSYQWKRVNQFLPTYYQIGDCSFTSNGHHGTPLQRLRSATWGYNLQENARPKGHVLGNVAFRDLFDKQLPILVAPDAKAS